MRSGAPNLVIVDVSERDTSAMIETISQALAKGDRIELRGFGAFSVRWRGAREARNPRTGEVVQVISALTKFRVRM